MSSSSSAPCDCFYCQYDTGYASNGYGACPFYATMGQPYVYYAQVARDQIDRRKNPNFFVKAFRWYTQEHTAPQLAQAQYTETSTSAPAADPDVAGFATWLDAKYEQFLREGHAHDERCVVVTQTSEGMGVQPQCQSQPGGNKRFTRIRLQSPWRKRQCFTNNASEGGDVPIDTNKSVVYLLEPKDLPRPISECCQVSSTPCCSVATVAKKVTCSRSATNTFTRSDIKHIDPVSVQEGVNLDISPQAKEHGCKPECLKKLSPDSKHFLQNVPSGIEKHKSRSKSRIAGLFKSKKTENTVYLKNTSCECSTLPPPKAMVDAETQYDLGILVKYACECTSRQAVGNTVPAAPVAHAETKSKQTWFQKSLLKISPKTSKRQKDVECQCEPDPKVDKNQYCTQCGCRCTEMREKLLCCECVRTACAKEVSAQIPPSEQTPPTPMKYTEYSLKQDSQPVTLRTPPHVKQQYVPILDMPPLPPPTMTTTPTPPTATPLQEEYAPKQDIPAPPSEPLLSPSAATPKPQPMREVSVVTKPQSVLSAPEKSEPYSIKGRLLGQTSFPCTICNSAQTSDHAINLDQGIRGYPLFLKIVCADRLNEDCFCRQ